MSEADLEYGPTPPDAEYEHTDIEPSVAVKFGVWLTIAMLLSGGIVYGAFWLFEGRSQARDTAVQQFPLAVGQVQEPPPPRLQTQPFKDVYLLKEGQRQQLTSYGWLDQGAGVVHIPIDEAMRIIAETGSVPAGGGPTAGLNEVVQDSSSGRTTARRH